MWSATGRTTGPWPAGSGTDAPSVVHLSASRNATIVASVTTIYGNRRGATSARLMAPSAAPPAEATTSTPNIGTPVLAETPASTLHTANTEPTEMPISPVKDHDLRAKRDDQHLQVCRGTGRRGSPARSSRKIEAEHGPEHDDRGGNRHFTTMSRQTWERRSIGARRFGSRVWPGPSALARDAGASDEPDVRRAGSARNCGPGGDQVPRAAATPVRRFGCRCDTASRTCVRDLDSTGAILQCQPDQNVNLAPSWICRALEGRPGQGPEQPSWSTLVNAP